MLALQVEKMGVRGGGCFGLMEPHANLLIDERAVTQGDSGCCCHYILIAISPMPGLCQNGAGQPSGRRY